MGTTENNLLLLGSSHRTVPLEVRERLAVADDQLAHIYEQLKEIKNLREVLVLNTCNRIELYTVSPRITVQEEIESFLCDFHRFDRSEFNRYSFRKTGLEVVRHLFEVSSGIDSQMVGETEIFGQLKDSYGIAIKHSSVGPLLHRLFQKSFQAAKWARTHTGVGKGHISIGNICVNLALRIFGKLNAARILVLGTGEVGEKTAKALKSRGADSITVTGRTRENVEKLAEDIAGEPLEFDQYPGKLSFFDIVICSTAAPEPLLTNESVKEAIQKRPNQPLFIIDLAVPRNVDPRASQLPNVFLYNLNDISQIANENLKEREAEIDSCREVLFSRADRLWKSLVKAAKDQ